MSIFLFSPTAAFMSNEMIELDEFESRHAIGSFRLKSNDEVKLLNGKGSIATGTIFKADKNKTLVKLSHVVVEAENPNPLTIGLCRPEIESRWDWFLEKATELGVNTIYPVISSRTTLKHFKVERFYKILIAAIKQSGNAYMPRLMPPILYENFLIETETPIKAIAHCLENDKKDWSDLCKSEAKAATILIGPEGDFTKDEIDKAIHHTFEPVSLGNLRLRTETAGIYAATTWNVFH